MSERVVTTVFGALNTWQRVGFTVLVCTAIVLNAIYLQHVITKIHIAAANPESRLSKRTDVPFPAFTLLARSFSEYFDSCDITNATLLYTDSDSMITFRPPPMLAGSLIPLAAHVRDSGKPANAYAAFIPSGSLSLSNRSVVIALTASSAATTAGVGSCDYVDVTVESPDGSPDYYGGTPTYSVQSNQLIVFSLAATADEDARTGAIQYRVAARQQITSRIPARYRAQTNASIVLVFWSDPTYTDPAIDWNTILVTYTWTDAAAACFTLLSASVTVVTLLFPLAASWPHQRMFIANVPKVGDRNTPARTTGHGMVPTDSQHTVPLVPNEDSVSS